MPGQYAANTDVPVSRSRDEIERTLNRFGADAFGYSSTSDGQVAVTFQLSGYRVLMRMQLPSREQFRLDSRGRKRTDTAVEKDWEQACRQRWRTFSAAIKAKLAMIDDGISTVEQEFLSQIVVGDSTIGERVIPQLRSGTLDRSLSAPAKIVELPERAQGGGR